MQYKQLPRILIEIAEIREARAKTRLAALNLLQQYDSLPRLGPYRKRSPEQALWRIASDVEQGPRERWASAQRLIAVAREAEATTKRCQNAPEEDREASLA